jgi:hypothetical protein
MISGRLTFTGVTNRRCLDAPTAGTARGVICCWLTSRPTVQGNLRRTKHHVLVLAAEAEQARDVLLSLRQSTSRASSPSFFSASFFAASDRAFVFFRSMVTLSIFPVNLLFPFA